MEFLPKGTQEKMQHKQVQNLQSGCRASTVQHCHLHSNKQNAVTFVILETSSSTNISFIPIVPDLEVWKDEEDMTLLNEFTETPVLTQIIF